MFRHHFQKTELSRTFYDAVTCIVTRFFLSYATTTFVLLELGVSTFTDTLRLTHSRNLSLSSLQASLRLYLKLFMCLHLIALLTVFVLPKLISSGNSSGKRSSTKLPSANDQIDSLVKSAAEDVEPKNDKLLAAIDVDSVNRKEHSENTNEANESSSSSSSCSSFSNSMNDISEKKHQRKIDSNYLLKDLINNKIKGETDNLSNLLMEKIEAANIEGLIDKTVNELVELKDDLMRMNEPEVYGGASTDGLRKRNLTAMEMETGATTKIINDGVDAFLKKEIDAIKEANVIPAVLSNGHAK